MCIFSIFWFVFFVTSLEVILHDIDYTILTEKWGGVKK